MKRKFLCFLFGQMCESSSRIDSKIWNWWTAISLWNLKLHSIRSGQENKINLHIKQMYQVNKKWKQKQMKQERKKKNKQLRWSVKPKARFFEKLKKTHKLSESMITAKRENTHSVRKDTGWIQGRFFKLGDCFV